MLLKLSAGGFYFIWVCYIFTRESRGFGGRKLRSHPKLLHRDSHFCSLTGVRQNFLVLVSSRGWDAVTLADGFPRAAGGIQLGKLTAAQFWLVHAALISKTIRGPFFALALGKIKHL